MSLISQHGARDIYITGSCASPQLREYSLLKPGNKGGFIVKKIIGYGATYEYQLSKNKFDLDVILKVYDYDQLIYLKDDLNDNLNKATATMLSVFCGI